MLDTDDAMLEILEVQDILEALANKDRECDQKVIEVLNNKMNKLKGYVRNSENKIVKPI